MAIGRSNTRLGKEVEDVPALLAESQTVAQFQEEIPQKPILRRFDIGVGHCADCGRHVQGRHPLQTSDALGAAAAQLGPNAQAMTALLKDKVGVS